MEFGRLSDVVYDATLHHNPLLDALADQPGQIHGRVDTNRREARPRISTLGELILREASELVTLEQNRRNACRAYVWYNIFIPRIRSHELLEPAASSTTGVSVAVVDNSVYLELSTQTWNF